MSLIASRHTFAVPAPTTAELFTPRASHALVVGAILALLLPCLSYLMLANEVAEAMAFHFLRPQVERQFGFTARPTSLGRRSAQYGPFKIVSVVPNGLFSSSGVHVGDICGSGLYHGDHASALYGSLAASGGGPVTLRFLRGPELDESVFITVPPPRR